MWSAPYKGLVKLYMLTALNKAAGLEGCVYVCVVVGVCVGGGDSICVWPGKQR